VTIEDLVGERLMIGLSGARLSDADVRVFEDTRAAGVILYRRNFEGPAALAALLDGLESALGRRLLVATDHEGGRIVMLGQGTTIFPDNLALGTAGEEAFAFRQGLFEGRELRRLGVDLNLGPCLDVLTERYSPNIGIRSYGKDPRIVSRYGVARIRGMAQSGLSACPKHFPGKGHSPLDAHLKLPTIDSTEADMRATHLPPFVEAMAAGVAAVMTSHPVYPKLDPSGVPATFSRRLVGDWLRGELRFDGVIVSDDLEMGAVSETCPIGEAAVRAAAAGHDLLLVCHTEPAQPIATRAVTEVGHDAADLRRALNGRVAVVFPRFSDLASRITIEPEIVDERGWVAGAFGAAGIAPETLVVGIEPTAEETAAASERAAAADVTVLFLFDAHLYASNRALLDALQARARRLAVVLLRDPYDAALLKPGVRSLTAYGFRKCQLDAVVARLTHA
jgi:beta-N-acetylhexosaminidase